MLLLSILYCLYFVRNTFQRKYLHSKLVFNRKLLTKYFTQAFSILLTALFITTVYSEEKDLNTTSLKNNINKVSEREYLNKASTLRRSDSKKSKHLATQALYISTENNNYKVSAQSHSLLGKLNRDAKDITQSTEHFLQASLIYKGIDDTRNLIISSVDYINVLLTKKNYAEATNTVNELLPIAETYGHVLPLALTITAKGDTYYETKHYIKAIEQYNRALSYLSGDEYSAKQQLAETYKRIAQAYKRLKNRKKTAFYYKKTLAIYTELQDKRLMARTLNTLAEAERYLNNFVVALDYSNKGLALHQQVNDPVGEAKALVGAGIIYRHIGRYEKSLEQFLKAYAYYQKENDVSGIAKTSNQIGLIYSRLEQFDQAKSFYQLTIDLPETKIEAKTLASALREMAVINLNSDKYVSARAMAIKAYTIYKNENDKTKQSLLARILGYINHAQNDDIQATIYYRESLALATKINSKIYQIKAQIPLAEILIPTKVDEAITLLKQSLKLSTEIKDKSQQQSAYRILRIAEASRGNFKDALRYSVKEMSIFKKIQYEKDENELTLAKANLYSHKMEIELDTLREKSRLDRLELDKKSNEIEIANQASKISELELTKNKYANIALIALLFICILLVIFIYRRFINTRKRNKELDYLATRDPLTNCFNRRVLLELLERDFSGLEQLTDYCIIMADIDHFKKVNDTYGHSVGDSVICGVASVLQSGVRQNDIVARFGGEEFCIVLPSASKEQAVRIVEEIRVQIENNHFDSINVTCSFGISSITFNAKSPSELINQADLALYQSKRNGRNRVTLWNSTL